MKERSPAILCFWCLSSLLFFGSSVTISASCVGVLFCELCKPWGNWNMGWFCWSAELISGTRVLQFRLIMPTNYWRCTSAIPNLVCLAIMLLVNTFGGLIYPYLVDCTQLVSLLCCIQTFCWSIYSSLVLYACLSFFFPWHFFINNNVVGCKYQDTSIIIPGLFGFPAP